MSGFIATNLPKVTSLFTAMAAFFIILAVIFVIAGLVNGKKARPIALVVFLAPAIILLNGTNNLITKMMHIHHHFAYTKCMQVFNIAL